MKIGDVVNFALATKALLNTAGILVPVKAFSPAPTGIGGTWETDVFDPALAAVSGMVLTDGYIELNEGQTVTRNGYMEDLLPILGNFDYKLKLCITDHSITDSFMSFGTGALKDSIRRHIIGDFHTLYIALMDRINAGVGSPNRAALIAHGFLGTDIDSITTAHDLAWGMNISKIDLSAEVSSLSIGNQALVEALLKYCQMIIDAIQAWAKSTGNKPIMKKASNAAILKTVASAAAKLPRDHEILMNTSICWLEHPVARDLMQITLMTEGGSATVCRQNTKTGVCSAGIVLVYNEMLSVKKKDIPGTGDCIIITNTGSGKIKVKVFRVKG